MSLTITISSWPASKVTESWGSGQSWTPLKISAYMLATRSGVFRRPSRSGSSPMASRISRTAFSIRPVSMPSGSAVTSGGIRVRARPGLRQCASNPAAGGGSGRGGGRAVLRGPLADGAEDRHDLGRVERLLLDEGGRQLVKGLAVLGQDVGRL